MDRQSHITFHGLVKGNIAVIFAILWAAREPQAATTLFGLAFGGYAELELVGLAFYRQSGGAILPQQDQIAHKKGAVIIFEGAAGGGVPEAVALPVEGDLGVDFDDVDAPATWPTAPFVNAVLPGGV